MTYIKSKWVHGRNPKDSIWLYSEIDDSRWEIRKVEVFSSGELVRADGNTSLQARVILSETQMPPLAEIVLDENFITEEISKEDFEHIWAEAA